MLPEMMTATQPVGWISDSASTLPQRLADALIAYLPYEQPPWLKHVH